MSNVSNDAQCAWAHDDPNLGKNALSRSRSRCRADDVKKIIVWRWRLFAQ